MNYTFNFQIYFPAVTICNQNRVSCGRLEKVRSACEEIAKSSNATEVEVDETQPEFTICNKKLGGENKTIIDYLYEQGRCNCRTRKNDFVKFYIHYK